MSELKNNLRSSFAQMLFRELTSLNPVDFHFFFVGHTEEWADDSAPPVAEDTIKTENDAKRNLISFKPIRPQDVSLVVPRYNWTSGTVYTQYDDTVDLHATNEKYYALVGAGDIKRVYLCLFNNNGAASTVPPVGTSSSEQTTADGYIWKFLYELTTEQIYGFLTDNWLPVTQLDQYSYADARALQLNVQLNAVDGAISTITVPTRGNSYTAAVNPGLSDDSYIVTSVSIDDNPLKFNVASQAGMNLTDAFYDGNWVVYFETGQVGTIKSYTVNQNSVTIELCEIYPSLPAITVNTQYSILPKIKIVGNGTGAVAIPVLDAQDYIESIQMISQGSGYDFASAFVPGNETTTLNTIIPPPGGHGFSAINELQPRHVLISQSLDFGGLTAENKNWFGLGTSVRQFGIIKNVKDINGEKLQTKTEKQYTLNLTKLDSYVTLTMNGYNNGGEDNQFFRNGQIISRGPKFHPNQFRARIDTVVSNYENYCILGCVLLNGRYENFPAYPLVNELSDLDESNDTNLVDWDGNNTDFDYSRVTASYENIFSQSDLTGATHIIGNTTGVVAEITSLSNVLSSANPISINLPIKNPTGQFILSRFDESGAVVPGELVSLLKRSDAENGNGDHLEFVMDADNAVILSQIDRGLAYQSSAKYSCLSKIVIEGDTDPLDTNYFPPNSWMYNETSGAIGKVINTTFNSATNQLSIWFLPESGEFFPTSTGENALLCVKDPYVDEIELVDDTDCAGHPGRELYLPVGGSVTTYNSPTPDRFSGNTVYIQNIEPIELTSDIHAAFKILLGF